ncbi:hypothetical protein KOW79_021358 [Hemibagrus wyckioides]|uniref:Uncharacterized protein n=1 Tax=Hemibagrus wyckioides TaxID=337641 RepID=A0A9D3N689_9TELE|nr:hypothetical protein KOW79_021358 [Hemibagrus wyckioides]
MHGTRLTCASCAAAFLGKKSSLQLQRQIIHSPPLHLGGATGSSWSWFLPGTLKCRARLSLCFSFLE